MIRPPTVDQLRNLAERTYDRHLQPEESARLLQGIELLAARKPPRRPGPPLAAARRLQRLKQRLRILHAPMERGGVEVCQECSGWDGQRCRGLVTPYPCPTGEAIEGPSGEPDGGRSGQEPANGAEGARVASEAAQGRSGDFEGAAA